MSRTRRTMDDVLADDSPCIWCGQQQRDHCKRVLSTPTGFQMTAPGTWCKDGGHLFTQRADLPEAEQLTELKAAKVRYFDLGFEAVRVATKDHADMLHFKGRACATCREIDRLRAEREAVLKQIQVLEQTVRP